jgi:hypothetical protein
MASSTRDLLAMLAVVFLLASELCARTSAEEAPTPTSYVEEKQQILLDLLEQWRTVNAQAKENPEFQRREAELRSKVFAMREELAKLTAAGGRQESAAGPAPKDPSQKSADQSLTPLVAGRRQAPLEEVKAIEAEAIQSALMQTRAQLAERERQLADYSKQLAKLERASALPPLQNAEVKVFSLANLSAAEAARTIESLFGLQSLRIATDERANSLIVMGTAESLPVVEALLMRLDQKANAEGNPEATAAASPAAPRSLLLRIFWLADGLPIEEGQDATEFLPESVIEATERLGLREPRLVTQTVNSLAVAADSEVEFSTSVPAVVFKQPAGLNYSGHMRPLAQERAALNVQIQVGGPSINCQLGGSLATPLGHYMVLGTANSVIGDPAMAQVSAMGMGIAPGMGGYGGEMGMYGRPRGGEYGREGGAMMGRGAYGRPARGGLAAAPAAVDPTTGAPAEGEAPPAGVEGAAPPVEPKYNTSRFAFVVQVIEGESFPAEKLDALPAGALR